MSILLNPLRDGHDNQSAPHEHASSNSESSQSLHPFISPSSPPSLITDTLTTDATTVATTDDDTTTSTSTPTSSSPTTFSLPNTNSTNGPHSSTSNDTSSSHLIPISPSSTMKVRFGNCPSRPPELRRRSSITLGVLARRSMLNAQAAAEAGLGGGGGYGYGAGMGKGKGSGGKDEIRTVYMSDAEWQEHLDKVRAGQPEPIDLGAVVTSSARNLWRKVRRNSSTSTTTSSPSQASITSLSPSVTKVNINGASHRSESPSKPHTSPMRLKPFRQRAESAPERVGGPLKFGPEKGSGEGSDNGLGLSPGLGSGSDGLIGGFGPSGLVSPIQASGLVSPMQEITEEEGENEAASVESISEADIGTKIRTGPDEEEEEEDEDDEPLVESVTPGSPPPMSGLQLSGIDTDIPELEADEAGGGVTERRVNGENGRERDGSNDGLMLHTASESGDGLPVTPHSNTTSILESRFQLDSQTSLTEVSQDDLGVNNQNTSSPSPRFQPPKLGQSTPTPISILQKPKPLQVPINDSKTNNTRNTSDQSQRSAMLLGSPMIIRDSSSIGGPVGSRAKDAAILGFEDWRLKPKSTKRADNGSGARQGSIERRTNKDEDVGKGFVGLRSVPRMF